MTCFRFPSRAAIAVLLAPAACFDPTDLPPDSSALGAGTEGDESGTGAASATDDGPGVTTAAPATESGGTSSSVTGGSTGDPTGEDTSAGTTGGPPAMCDDGIVSPGEVCLGPIAMLPSPQADFLFGADFNGGATFTVGQGNNIPMCGKAGCQPTDLAAGDLDADGLG